LPRAAIYDGDRHRVTLTSQVESVADSVVGQGKKFARLSDLVNSAILIAYGSEQAKNEAKRKEATKRLQAKNDEFEKLRKKHPHAEGRSRVLAQFYSIPMDHAVELAEKAQGDWDEYSGKCSVCPIRCSKANQEGACWQVKGKEAKVEIAWFASPSNILSELLAAAELSMVNAEVGELKSGAKDFSSSKEVVNNG